MAKKQNRRSKGAGSIYKKGNIYMARWVVTLDGVRKVYTQSTETGVEGKALERLAEFIAPYKLGLKEKVLRNQVAELGGIQAQIKKFEDEKEALGIFATWDAYKNAPNRPDSGDRTMVMYASQFKRFAGWMEKHHPKVTELRKVTEEIAFQFAGQLGRTLTPNSYNKYMVLFRRIWKVLYKVARLNVNPWVGLDNKLLNTHSRRELTIEELTKVCESVQGEMRGLFAVGIYCGLRLGDAVQLKWGNVDMTRRSVMVVPSKTARRANGKVLRIPIHHSLYDMLSEMPETKRSGYIFPELAALYQHDDTTLVKRIKKVFKECEIETMSKVAGRSKMATEVGFHSLRHSFVSLSANAGANLAAVQAVIGHSSPAMTRHYLHADQDNVRNAVALLPDVIRTNTLPKHTDATDDALKAILAMLAGLSQKDLKTVIKNAQKLITR